MENTQVMPGADKTPEQIQDEMAQTRESLTRKVAALESQVVGSVQTAADTLSGTVEAMKSFVTTAPGTVSQTVKQAADVVGETLKETLDISGQARKHPWAVVGTSALLGFVTGMLLFRESTPRQAVNEPFAIPTPPHATQPSKPGILDDMVSMLGRKLRDITENVIDTASAAVNRNVREEVPKLVDAATERLTPGTI